METLDKFIENKFGIANGFEDVDNMITNILLLHTSLYLKGTLPASWKTNLPDTNNFAIKNNAYIFVDRFMKSDLSEAYILLSDRVAEKINFERVTKDWDIESYEDVDTFVGYDKHIIERIKSSLIDGVNEFERYLSIIKQRRKSFWNDTCRELISKDIRDWLMEMDLADWKKKGIKPPKFEVQQHDKNHFRVIYP